MEGHDGVALQGPHGVGAIHVAMDAHPCDIVAHAGEDTEQGVTQRAVGAIGRSELLDYVHLAGEAVLVQDELAAEGHAVLNRLAIDGVHCNRERVLAVVVAVGRNRALDGNVAGADGHRVGERGDGLTVDEQVEGAITGGNVANAQIPGIELIVDVVATLGVTRGVESTNADEVLGIVIALDNALDTQVAIGAQAHVLPTALEVAVGGVDVTYHDCRDGIVARGLGVVKTNHQRRVAVEIDFVGGSDFDLVPAE